METTINLLDALQHIGDYVLLRKWDDFPNWLPGSDVDILALDYHESLKHLQVYLSELLDGQNNYLRISESPTHIHADIMHEEKILLRFDLMNDFFFPNFEIMPSYKTYVFMNRIQKEIEGNLIYLPEQADDLLIRYFEYIAFFEQRPDKLKHLDYILACNDKDQIQKMVINSHRFIRYPHKNWDREIGHKTKMSEPVKSTILYRMLRKIKHIIQRAIFFKHE